MIQYSLAPLLFCTIFLGFWPIGSLADTPQPGKFFEQGYVKGTIDKKQNGILSQSSGSSNTEERTSPTTEISNNTTGEKVKEFQTPIYNVLTESDTRTLPIESISYIINGRDQAEALGALKFFSDFLIEHEVQPGKVYVLGSPLLTSQDIPYDWARIVSRGGSIAFSRYLADEYQLEKMPSWIIRTEKGDVLLEGYDDISSFLNLKGELKVSKILKEPDALPQPEEKEEANKEVSDET